MKWEDRHVHLVLEVGSVFKGQCCGFPKSVAGEVVYNPGMVSSPESAS